MSAMYNQMLLQWKDTSGLLCTNFLTLADQSPFVNANLSAFATAAQAISELGLQAIQWQQTIVLNHTPPGGPYPTVYDRANFMTHFANQPQAGLFALPGPIASILQPNNVVVDMSKPLVQAFVTALKAIGGNSSGAALTSVPQGRRVQIKRQPQG